MKTIKVDSSYATAVLLGAVLGFTFWANSQVFEATRNLNGISNAVLFGRTPASALLNSERSGSIDAERNLVSLLSDESAGGLISNRKLASIGTQPDPMDELRFQKLEGKYSITVMEEGTISHIAFVDTPQSVGRPTTVSNREDFLKEHAELFKLEKNNIKRVSVTEVKGHLVETYVASENAHSENPIIIKVEIDDQERLYKVQRQRQQANEFIKL